MGYHYLDSARRYLRGRLYSQALTQFAKAVAYDPTHIFFPLYTMTIVTPIRIAGAIRRKLRRITHF